VTHAIGDAYVDGPDVPAGMAPPPYPYLAPYREPNRFYRAMQRLYARVPTWGAPAAIAVCFAGAAGYVLASNPTDNGAGDLPGCIVKLTTGLDCPGCGGTRAFYFLLRGNIPEAARHHAIAVFAAPFLLWLYLGWAVKRVTGRRLPVPRIGARTVSAFLLAWALFMVLRNLPFAPFTDLYV
jgi:hypothetical protein